MPLTERYGRKDMKAAMRSRKSSGYFRKIAPEERFKFRPIVEPTEWEKGHFHYIADADIKFMWCSRRPDCPRCEIDHKPTPVWLANVLDIDNGKVQILQVPNGIANLLYERFEKYGTICDRDYEILRQGSSLNDTKYMLDWEDKMPRKLSRWTPADIAAAIMMELGLNPEDVEEEPEDEVPTAGRRDKKSSPPKKSPRYEEEEDDEEDYDEDEEEGDDEEVDQYAELDRSELKAEIKKYDSGFVAKKSQSDEDLREILRDLASDSEEEEDDEDDEDEEEEAPPPHRSKKSPAKVSSGKPKRVIRRA